MKKTGMLLAALWAAWTLCGGALAAQYADVEALLAAWTQEGMPDYVSSVCSVDGSSEHLAILLTPGNEDREAEIRASLTDDSGVTIGVGAYSWAERERVLHEIAHEHMDGGAVVTIGDGWITMDGQITGFGESGLESRVVVGVLADRAEEADYALLAFDTGLTYDRLCAFCDLVRGGKPYIATHPDLNCPTETGFIPDVGSFMALIETSTGRRPDRPL